MTIIDTALLLVIGLLIGFVVGYLATRLYFITEESFDIEDDIQRNLSQPHYTHSSNDSIMNVLKKL